MLVLVSREVKPFSTFVGGLQDPAHSETGDTMMMGLYFTPGIFLLIAARTHQRIAA